MFQRGRYWGVLPSSIKVIFSLMGFLLENGGFTVFQNFLSLSIVFDCSDLKCCLLA